MGTGNERSGGRGALRGVGRAAGARPASARPQGLSAAASRWAPVACGPCCGEAARLPLHLQPAPGHVAWRPSCLPGCGRGVTCATAGLARAGLRTASLVWAWETGRPRGAAGRRAVPAPAPVRRGGCQCECRFWGNDDLSDGTSSVGDTGSWQNWSHPFGAVFRPEGPKHR